MTIFESLAALGHEQLVLCSDPSVDYRGIIAVHSTALGTAVGGTRWWSYPSDDAAITDALRLSRGMSFKNALARLPLGGGKSVIMAPSRPVDRAAVLRAHGRFIDRLGGIYITAEDVGTSPEDMEVIAETTPYVAGRVGVSGDPSPHTARGVLRAMEGAAMFRWGSAQLAGKVVALQGCGNVGYHLAKLLAEAGARIVASDIDPARVARVVSECGATEVPADRIHAVPAEIFAPCALGAILDDRSIPELQAALVVGGANNQLLEPRHGWELQRRGITYVPDYVANAGGVSYGGAIEVLKVDRVEAIRRVDAIYDTTLMVLERARAEGIPPSEAADRMAAERIRTRRVE
jgi:leucine dehydrogenase